MIRKKTILIKSDKELETMREGGNILAGIMKEIASRVAPGKTTYELDKLAEELVFSRGGVPAFKGYQGEKGTKPFPATICASLNFEVVHGIPARNKVLQEGDILKIDIGMRYQGMYTDMARTFFIGKISSGARKLIDVTEQSFWEGIRRMKPEDYLSAYSKAVQEYVEHHGFSVVRNLVGHGIGRTLHEEPNVLNYYDKKFSDVILKPGMTFALEPMVNMGGKDTVLAKDGWTFITRDRSLSAHYENTVVIAENGVEVLTVWE